MTRTATHTEHAERFLSSVQTRKVYFVYFCMFLGPNYPITCCQSKQIVTVVGGREARKHFSTLYKKTFLSVVHLPLPVYRSGRMFGTIQWSSSVCSVLFLCYVLPLSLVCHLFSLLHSTCLSCLCVPEIQSVCVCVCMWIHSGVWLIISFHYSNQVWDRQRWQDDLELGASPH